MPQSSPPPVQTHRGVDRRELLQIGYSGMLGASLPWLASQTVRADAASSGSPKSIVIIFLTGAPSHHDMFDMKPQAPAEIRGEFQPISTEIPGLHVCEHLPGLARRAGRYAVVRTLSHDDNNHLMSTHHVLTGEKQPGGFFDKVASRDDWPCYAAGLSYVRPRNDGLPTGVNLPTFLMSSPLTWPGQHAGFLGPNYDPWQINGDPNSAEFRVDALLPAPGISIDRLSRRESLLQEVNRQQRKLEDTAESLRMNHDQQLAISLLTSSRLSAAFELDREPDEIRERYGRHTTGQSLLLARRLIQVGVPIVQANIGRVQTWDNHSSIFPTLKERLLPPLDQGVSALLDDLADLGLLDETLVVLLGEFGRTPKINNTQGRDHWGPCFFGLFAGAGVLGGQVIGRSDEIGAYPVTRAYSPNDVGATLYHLLGLPEEVIVRDRLNRPVQLNRGELILPLFTGEAV